MEDWSFYFVGNQSGISTAPVKNEYPGNLTLYTYISSSPKANSESKINSN
jgi:hypothetical protein